MKDCVIPFSLFSCSQKGRLVYLDESVQKIIDQHNYPLIVNRYMIELLSILTVIGSDTKTKSLVSLQINADALSPISLLVADLESNGNIRAYARFDAEKIKNIDDQTPLQDIFKNGYMVLTIDFETGTDRYQALVELKGKTLTESIEHYCQQSDQIPTVFSIHLNDTDPNLPKATALMIQQLPLSSNAMIHEREEKIEQWSTIVHFLKTLKDTEALSTEPKTLLFRLFYEADIAIAEEKSLQFQCRCSLEKVKTVIQSFSNEEKEALCVDNHITADCEFCDMVYTLKKEDVMTASHVH